MQAAHHQPAIYPRLKQLCRWKREKGWIKGKQTQGQKLRSQQEERLQYLAQTVPLCWD